MTKADASGDRALRTHAALIDAAIAQFGRRGYDAVTTREIAAAAETNVSSIKYHFGGKEELYRSALESVVAEIQTLIDPVLAALAHKIARAGSDRTALRALAREFATNWCRAVLGDRRLQRRIPCIVRELIAPTASFDVIYDGFFRRLYDALAALIAGVHGTSPAAAETRVRTHALVNMLLGFVEGESIFWRQMNWKRYTPERIEIILPTVADTFVAALG
jgi:TetR/AcrR family transcriptional regulator, regulator of cefoperazone and chloramphenicol sensitivity